MATNRLRIGWMTTGRGPGSYGALEYVFDAIDRGLPVDIAVVFINRDRGEAEATDRLIEMVEARGIPVEAVSSVAFRKQRGGKRSRPGEPLPAWRTDYDAEVVRRLEPYDVNLVVLFGYMLIATEALYGKFTLLNDHPALPDGPIGTYQQVIAELIKSGADRSGCLMNIATGDLDRGPVVSFCGYPIRDTANEELWRAVADISATTSQQDIESTELYADIRARGVAREQPFLVETLRAIATGRLEIPPQSPIDLSDAVDLALNS